MHCFVSSALIGGTEEKVTLSREESEHAARVLRLRPGEAVRLLDGAALYDAVLVEVNERETIAAVTARCPSPEPPRRFWPLTSFSDSRSSAPRTGSPSGRCRSSPLNL